MRPTISVILPVYSESETLDKLKERLMPVLVERASGSFEVLFIDDGSRDGSDRIIDGYHERDPRFNAIHFSRNFGHQAALQAGLDAAAGDAVALMDADLQDPPELLEQFIEYWRQGYDVVYAVRKKLKEALWKRAAYKVFYRSMKAISEIQKSNKNFMQENSLKVALKDIRAAIARYPLVAMLGWQDVRQRYRRSSLGPFWLTISMGVMIGAIGVVFGQIFNTPMQEYLPFLTIGIMLWGFISSVITDGCAGFISAEGIIKQLPIPLFVHIQRMLWRNTLILCHNIIIFPLAFYATGNSLSLTAFLSIPGFFLLLLNLAWAGLILAVLCARYRDLPQIVGSVLQVAFYLTPIMWMPALLPSRVGLSILYVNPIFHLLEIVRAPLLGKLPTMYSWIFSVALAVFGWVVAIVIYGRYKCRIAYWL